MKVIVRPREIYGRTVWDPANRNAEGLAAIAGTKTLSDAVLALAREYFDAEIIAAIKPVTIGGESVRLTQSRSET